MVVLAITRSAAATAPALVCSLPRDPIAHQKHLKKIPALIDKRTTPPFFSHALSTYSPVRVSTFTTSPGLKKSGT
jgi:hypothetical protein